MLGPLLEFAEDSAKFLRECTNNPGEDGQSKAVSKRGATFSYPVYLAFCICF